MLTANLLTSLSNIYNVVHHHPVEAVMNDIRAIKRDEDLRDRFLDCSSYRGSRQKTDNSVR